MKTIARYIAVKLLNFIDWIYENRPEGERLTERDLEMRAEVRKLRRKIKEAK